MRKHLLKYLVLVLLSLCSIESRASHIFGLDFYYTYISGNTYAVNLVIYGDCSGAAFPSFPTSSPQVKVYNGTTLINTINLLVQPPATGIEVTPVCPADVGNTTCVNPAGTIPGIKKFVYTTNVTLPGTSTVWRFVFTGNMGGGVSAGRSISITNVLMGASGSTIQLTDTLNNTVYTNNGAIYTTIPTPFYCMYQPANFNPGAVDADGDSLRYGLIAGVDAATGSALTYIPPYTPTFPLGVIPGSFSFNEATGQLAFTPNIAQKSLVVYNVREFRGGTFVGNTQREMTVVTQTCTNAPPSGVMSSPSAGTLVSPTQLNICANTGPFNFHINPTDPDGDTIIMTASGLPAGATLTISNNATLAPLSTFSWNTTGVTPGDYTFFINYQDRGCPLSNAQTIAYTIRVLPVPTGTTTLISPVSCVAKGKFQISPSGVTSPYTIGVFNGATPVHTFSGVTGTITDSLVAGTYTIRVTNSENCSSTIPLTLVAPPLPSISLTSASPLCTGASTGTITAAGSGGTTPYTYAMGTGTFGSSGAYTGLPAGTYTVTVKDAQSCTSSASATLTDPPAMHVFAGITSPVCSGVPNGSVTLTPFGSAGPYTYAMGSSSYGPSNLFGGLAPGSYTFHVKNANGCIKDTTVTLADSLHIGITASAPSILCNGGSATVTVLGTGSPAPYTYAYGSSSYGTTNTFPLSVGTYALHVRDANMCQHDTTITLTQPTPVIITPTVINVACHGADGSISVGATGGTPGYTYSLNSGSYGTSSVFSPLSAGTYTVNVKDANGCLYTASTAVTEPSGIILDSVRMTKPTCNGSTNGSLQVYAHGGVTPYNYAVGAGSYGSSSLFSSLAAGTYTLHTKDANGCSKDTVVTLIQPAPLSVAASVVRPVCNPIANGSVTLATSGGTPAYSYAVGAGAFGASTTFGSLAAGTYAFHIKDLNGCTKDTTISLTDSLHVGITVTAPSILCNGGSATVTVLGTGSPAAYTYAYGSSAFGTTNTFPLTAGTYALHVRDANMCQHDTAITLTQPTPGVVAPTVVNVACHGADGSISVGASGGTPGYTYSLNSGSYGTSSTFTPLSAGSYTVNVKDANGCIYTATTAVTEPSGILLDSVRIAKPSCYGSANGTLQLYAHGGVTPYTYAIGSGSYVTTSLFGSLAAGTYTLHIKDANGCSKDTVINMLQPAPVTVAAGVVRPICSPLANGSVTLTTAGGTPTYSYAIGAGTFGASSVFSSLASGTYAFHIKDVNGCTKDTTISLADSLHVGIAVTTPSILCNGGSATVTVLGTGSPATYTYAYGSSAFGTTNSFPLTAGTYALHVRDANTCQHDTTITLTQPAPGVVTPTPVNVVCHGAANGSISVGASGGTPGYTYSLNGGSYGTPSTFTPLSAGTYTVNVKDANGCIYSATTSVTEPTSIILDSVRITKPSCYGSTNGSLQLFAHGGATPYTYASGTGSYVAASSFTGLGAGTYALHIKDANGCIKDTTVNMLQPAQVGVSANVVRPICSTATNGSVTLIATGGAPAYTYATGSGSFGGSSVFSPLAAGTYAFHIKDANGCIKDTTITLTDSLHIGITASVPSILCNGGASTVMIGGTGSPSSYTYASGSSAFGTTNTFSLTAGTYTLHVRDANMCQHDSTITITQPTPGIVTPTPSNVLCHGAASGIITVSASGGTPGYTYSINSGSYGTSSIFSPLIAGSYIIKVKDANGCIYTATTTNILEPAAIILDSVHMIKPTCYGSTNGSAQIYTHGGVSPYAYAIGTGAYTTSSSFTGLAAGTYTLHVKDANGCIKDTVINLLQPARVAMAASVVRPICSTLANGSVTLTGIGGTPSYTYSMGTGAFGSTTAFSPLAAGTYAFHIKDANGCTNDTMFYIADSLVVSATMATTPVICFGTPTGSITTTGAGGTSPYTYAIGSGTYSGTGTFSGLTNGTYIIHVKDNNGCIYNTIANVTQPTALNPSITLTNPTCYGYTNGTIAVAAVGGTPAYQYAVNSGSYSTSATFTTLGAGSKVIHVKDDNGCIRDTTVTLTDPAPVEMGLAPNPIQCHGETGAVTVSGTGGTSPYWYAANGGSWQTSNLFTGLGATTHFVHVKDGNGCARDTSFSLTDPKPLTFVGLDTTNPTCNGYKDGAVILHANGGTQPYRYSTDNVTYTPDSSFSVLGEGFYTLYVKDANGCHDDTTMALKGLPPMWLNATVVPVTCYGKNNGAIIAQGGGAFPPKSYEITGPNVDAPRDSVGGLLSGTYVITVTDSLNCKKDTSVFIPQPSEINIKFAVVNNICDGFQDRGVITASVSGGSQPYNYRWNKSPDNAPTIGNLPTGHYAVWVTDSNNCTVADTVNVTYEECCKPFIPDAFTPNGDGKNDVFKIEHQGNMRIVEFSVYNRFGEQVFTTNKTDEGWDGMYKGVQADMGVYFYYARIICGMNRTDVTMLKGDVTLIR